ncbi:MAG TPA: helix-turn-helix transcriptional regulator [Steroidobacteraceae bacterium]|nr:helix-turn-helix transcriptional regulator [Steroidobacteraceae bacterium]
MDMQIDSNRVKAERERRAWSQEHLAAAAGLSLRTVQRVETSGSASLETLRALASVFELEVAALRAQPGPAIQVPARRVRGWRYAAVAASAVVALGALFTRDARAGDVQLDVGVTMNDAKLSQSQVVATEGRSAEIRLEGQVRVFVNPAVTQQGQILLSIRVEEPSGSKWVEVAEPRLLAANDTTAEVNVTSPKGNKFRITIRPRQVL